MLDMEEKMLVLQAIRTPHRNWQGQSLEMAVQVAEEDNETNGEDEDKGWS